MCIRLAAIALSLLLADLSFAQTKDAEVVTAAVTEWQKALGADVRIHVEAESYSLDSLDVEDFIAKLKAGGADISLIGKLVTSVFRRNDGNTLPVGEEGPRSKSVTFHVARPGIDGDLKHAVVVGSPGDGWIWIALLAKKDGTWSAMWRGRTKPVMATPRTPGPAEIHTPFRVGGDVKAPVVIKRVNPIYPGEAKERRISGVVILETFVGKDGRVGTIRVLKALPYGLDQAAVDAVRQWEFEPATLGGQAVDVLFNLTIMFKSEE